jgi:murein DD-endopeptidase MepM/ murein hydrolase activator NlpD
MKRPARYRRIALPGLVLAALPILIALSAPMAGAQIYSWVDENGLRHYSDRRPESNQPVETLGIPHEPRSMVSSRRGGERHEPEHFFRNHYHGPAQIELTLAEADNVLSMPKLPARFVIPGNVEQGLVRFGAVDPTAAFSYRLAYTLVPGAPFETLPEDLDFFPPFARGKTFSISQGIDDDQTHSDAANRYAVDIVMPMGTPVLAARGGVVMESESSFADDGRKDERLLDRANFIRLLHDDGTMGIYAHLQQHSLRVQPGMRVPAGHWIANSGNSGYSSGPHLHFVVQMNIGMALEALPLRFRQPDGSLLDPDRAKPLEGVLAFRR